jgi:nitric oxide reductase activation protein
MTNDIQTTALTQGNEELKTLERSFSRWEMVAKLMALPTMILATWLTTKGLFDSTIEAHAANTEGMVTVAMTALVAIVLIGGGTMLLFDLAMQAGRKQRKQVIGLTLAIIPLVFGISTYNAILSTSA